MEATKDISQSKTFPGHFDASGMMSLAPSANLFAPQTQKCALCGGECQGECPECREKKESGERVLALINRSRGSSGLSKQEISAGKQQLALHSLEDCEEQKDACDNACRRLPNVTTLEKAKRALCWAACMEQYARCIATSAETLTFAALVAAIVLAAADGPLPIGDAAAAAILISIGIFPE
jgi:hypothetical protein